VPNVVLTILLSALSQATPAHELKGFPVDACDFIVECDKADVFVEALGDGAMVEEVLSLVLSIDVPEQTAQAMRGKHKGLLNAFLDGGMLGGRADETGAVEWIAWCAMPAGRRQELLASFKPVRKADRLVAKGLGIALVELGHGLLVSSEPPGALRAHAVASMQGAKWIPRDGPPVVLTMDHVPGITSGEGVGSHARVALSLEGSALKIECRGEFEEGVLKEMDFERRLDVNVLDRLPPGAIGAFVEHADAGLAPGVELVDFLFPHLVEPIPPDERWSRRLVILGETQYGETGARIPSIAIAIEADGPGATARRQDLAMLASLNSLRNRLGSKAGLQHLPSLRDLPEEGIRTVYIRPLLDPALGGHPMARDMSVNWCVTEGAPRWQLYATCPQLATHVSRSLSGSDRVVSCKRATHAGRVDARLAARHLGSWKPFAGQFVADDRIEDFHGGIELVSDLLDGSEAVQWEICVEDRKTIDATIRIWPRRSARPE